MPIRIFLSIYFFLFYCAAGYCQDQSCGLSFYGNEVDQDKRTGLDLSPNETICINDNFELAFDLKFKPNYKEYFGYIFRISNQNNTIDFLYDGRVVNKNHFIINFGDNLPKLTFDIPKNQLFNQWNRIIIKFDFINQIFVLKLRDRVFKKKLNVFEKGDCFNFLFGANNLKNISNTDVPHMDIKKITIKQRDKLTHSWLLNELNGDKALDDVSNKYAKVVNPLWIKKMYRDWQIVKSFKLKGASSIAYDEVSEKIFVIGCDSLLTYDIINEVSRTYTYKSGKYHLPNGNQSFYNPIDKRLYNFYIDQKKVNQFNFKTLQWSSEFEYPTDITVNWHFNKFFSPIDSSLYTFGGYGQFTYKNFVFKHKLNSKIWDTLKVAGDSFIPRYLSSSVASLNNKGVFIVGGYGSITGQQILSPKFLYDLLYFDIKNRTFKKPFNLKVENDDFVFGNSMVLDNDSNLYALTYPKHKFNTQIQLIKISLKDSTYKSLGNKIPFLFHDAQSYSAVYFSKTRNKFLVVTTFFNDKGDTDVKIFTLNSPPISAEIENNIYNKYYYGYYLIVFILLILILWFLIKKFRKNRLKDKIKNEINQTFIPEEIIEQKQINSKLTSTLQTNSIFLFGDLQLFDSKGEDITKFSTPLIKELFLAILLYTLRWGRGISSDKLNELIWFDKSVKSARNNRSVNIAKLKTVLDKLDACQVTKDTGYWTIDLSSGLVKIDYLDYLNIINDKNLNQEKIIRLISIIQRGSFLPNTEYEWLDSFKSEISNEIIDVFNHFIRSVNLSSDPEFLIKLSDAIFLLDPVNEEAMVIKCRSLAQLGKHSLAQKIYENFLKEYQKIYNEPFERELNKILNS